MDKPPLVSVVVPTRNRADLLLRALNSLRSQSFSNFEVLVVDDGGTDETEAVVQGLGDSRFFYFRKDHEGAAQARNFGLANTSGEFVAFLDSDDEVLPTWIEDLIQPTERYDLSISMCTYLSKDIKTGLIQRSENIVEGEGLQHLDNLLAGIFLVRTDIAKAVGGYSNLPAMQQKDFGRKLRYHCERNSLKCFRTNKPLLVWHQHPGHRLSTDSRRRYQSLLILTRPDYPNFFTIDKRILRKYLYEASALSRYHGTLREEITLCARSFRENKSSLKALARLIFALAIGPFQRRLAPRAITCPSQTFENHFDNQRGVN